MKTLLDQFRPALLDPQAESLAAEVQWWTLPGLGVDDPFPVAALGQAYASYKGDLINVVVDLAKPEYTSRCTPPLPDAAVTRLRFQHLGAVLQHRRGLLRHRGGHPDAARLRRHHLGCGCGGGGDLGGSEANDRRRRQWRPFVNKHPVLR